MSGGKGSLNRKTKIIAGGLLVISVTLLLAAYVQRPQLMGSNGTGWRSGAFRSNGERIYFTATNGPVARNWMMGDGQLVCASCHGPNGRGGVHNMGMMQSMTAKDIRWSVLQDEFDGEGSLGGWLMRVYFTEDVAAERAALDVDNPGSYLDYEEVASGGTAAVDRGGLVASRDLVFDETVDILVGDLAGRAVSDHGGELLQIVAVIAPGTRVGVATSQPVDETLNIG
jgi:hypothetical protein